MERVISIIIIKRFYPTLFSNELRCRKIHNKNYYSQETIINEICDRTKSSKNEVSCILNEMSDIITEKLSNTDNETEIRILNGIKVIGKVKQFNNSNLPNIQGDDIKNILSLKPRLTESFKKKVRLLRKVS